MPCFFHKRQNPNYARVRLPSPPPPVFGRDGGIPNTRIPVKGNFYSLASRRDVHMFVRCRPPSPSPEFRMDFWAPARFRLFFRFRASLSRVRRKRGLENWACRLHKREEQTSMALASASVFPSKKCTLSTCFSPNQETRRKRKPRERIWPLIFRLSFSLPPFSSRYMGP